MPFFYTFFKLVNFAQVVTLMRAAQVSNSSVSCAGALIMQPAAVNGHFNTLEN